MTGGEVHAASSGSYYYMSDFKGWSGIFINYKVLIVALRHLMSRYLLYSFLTIAQIVVRTEPVFKAFMLHKTPGLIGPGFG